jgi:8-oxo-dGTP pyrophosphatase MutT (NUDIX family)
MPSPRKPGDRGSGRAGGRVPGRQRLRKVEETSAGGLVVDRSGDAPRVAIIGRRDRRGRLLWSLPKGHLERGETAEDAAVREVEEETGIRGRVVATLGTIDYWFVAENRRIHKTVHHYLLEASGGELSDEDIEVDEVAWVPLDEVRGRLAYAGERRLAATAVDLLADSA